MVYVDVDESLEVEDSAEVEFTCGCCNHTGVTDAIQFKSKGTVTVFIFRIPKVTTETSLKCSSCEATYRSSKTIDALMALSPEQLRNQFAVRIGFVEKFLVLSGWLLIITGPVALALFIAAWFMVPLAATGWRRATFVGLIASGIMTAMAAILMVVAAFG